MQYVYAFAFPRAGRKILAIKGEDGNRDWIVRSKQKTRGGALWIVGVDGIKGHLVSRLSRGTSIRFSNTLPAVWFEQFASERAIVRNVRGQPKRQFVRIAGRRAEALDCVVYAFAARQILTINWDARAEALRNQDGAPAPQARPRTIRSSWMDR